MISFLLISLFYFNIHIPFGTEVLRNMSIIAEDENLLKRAAKYLRKLVSENLPHKRIEFYVLGQKYVQ